MGVCPNSPHVLCGSGEGMFDRVPRGILWGVHHPRVWGPGAFTKGCSVSVRPGAGAWFTLPPAMMLLQMMLSCWLHHQARTFSLCWSGLQPSVKQHWIAADWIGALRIACAASVVYRKLVTVVVKKELSRKAKLSIYQSIYVPTLTYGHELWVITERTRSRIQAAEMSFLRRGVAGRSLRDKVRSSVTREELGVEPLLPHIKRSQ
ncbi:hypothetical protein L3Q82_005898 [Scortum barcoo]|uniref:Uncharacterized protein n=1 Tax=Scortum barcoo TaxID=214431 RepID=A0ACB8V7A3_9TELE|nr:hypothetical protein L3Q82_005898 [Scortum barcoo]